MNILKALTKAIMSKPTPESLTSLARKLEEYGVSINPSITDGIATVSFIQNLHVKSIPVNEGGNKKGCDEPVIDDISDLNKKLWVDIMQSAEELMEPKKADQFIMNGFNQSKVNNIDYKEFPDFPSLAVKRLNTFKPGEIVFMTTPGTLGESWSEKAINQSEKLHGFTEGVNDIWSDIFSKSREMRHKLIERKLLEHIPNTPVRVRYDRYGAISSLMIKGVTMHVSNMQMYHELKEFLECQLTLIQLEK